VFVAVIATTVIVVVAAARAVLTNGFGRSRAFTSRNRSSAITQSRARSDTGDGGRVSPRWGRLSSDGRRPCAASVRVGKPTTNVPPKKQKNIEGDPRSTFASLPSRVLPANEIRHNTHNTGQRQRSRHSGQPTVQATVAEGSTLLL